MNLAVVLLAAGGSTRLGEPKQLLVYGGRSLLRGAAERALAVAAGGPVAVVLGAGAERLRAELAGLAVEVVENPGWERGMGGSVRSGMARLDELARARGGEEPDGVLLMLCDQPLVGVEALGRVARAWAEVEREDAVAAAAYEGTVGVPTVFGRAYFGALRGLPEEGGAKGLLRRFAEKVVAVPLPEAGVDIDTREQFERLVGGGGSVL